MGAAAGVLFVALNAAAAPAISLVASGAYVEVTGIPDDVLFDLERRLESFEDWSSVLRISVLHPSGDSNPPVLGRYEAEGPVLRFRPMFPFDRGRDYRVELRLGGTPVVAVVSLPALDLPPSAEVIEIFPSADRLPENQLKLYIHFSDPMAGGDGLAFVKLLDGEGREVVDPFLPLGSEFWDRERRRYTVFFDPGRVKRGILPNERMGRPLRAGERYTLVVDASWRDARGVGLVAGFRKDFIAGPADESPVELGEWRLQAPSSGTREPLVLDFPEPLDRALLERALAVPGVEGEAEVSRKETQWSFTPAVPWEPGRYEVTALDVLEDLAGNRIGAPFEVDRFDRIEGKADGELHRLSFVIRE